MTYLQRISFYFICITFLPFLFLLFPSHLYFKKPKEKKIIRTCDKGEGEGGFKSKKRA
jgi:hypothetical protein